MAATMTKPSACQRCRSPLESLAPGEWWCPTCLHRTTRRGRLGRWLKPGVRGRLTRTLRQRRRPASLAGWFRLWWYDLAVHVLFEGGERCQDCGRGYVLWRAPDDLYAEVHGSARGLLCPACFARQAAARGIIIEYRATVFRRRPSRSS